MVTARVEEADRLIGLELGADDYILKPFSPREVVARVRAVLRRATTAPVTPSVLRAGDLEIDPDSHTVTNQGVEIDLTPTEFNLLATLAAQPGRVSPVFSYWRPPRVLLTKGTSAPLMRISRICGQKSKKTPKCRSI